MLMEKLTPWAFVQRNLALILFVFFSIPHLHAATIVQNFNNHAEFNSGFFISPQVNIYSTGENYSSNGTSTGLPYSGKVFQSYYDLGLTYGFTSDLFLFARLSFLYTQVTSQAFSNGAATGSGLGDQLVAISYRFWRDSVGDNLVFQTELTFPAYNNAQSLNNVTPFLGDQSVDFTAGLFTEWLLPFGLESLYFVEAGAAYTYRSMGFSSAVPWQFVLKRDPLQGLYVSVGGRGQRSLNDSTQTNAQILSAEGVSGSAVADAQNSEWTVGELCSGYRALDGDLYYGKITFPIAGANAPIGLQFLVGAKFDFGRWTGKARPRSGSIRDYGEHRQEVTEHAHNLRDP